MDRTDFIKNRNRIVNILDNAAKILDNRKNIREDAVSLIFSLRELSNLLRDNDECERTVEQLSRSYSKMLDIINHLRSSRTEIEASDLEELRNIAALGIEKGKEEKIRNASSTNSLSYYKRQLETVNARIQELSSEIENLERSYKKETKEYEQKKADLTQQKVYKRLLIEKIREKEKMEDEVKELKNKVLPLTKSIDDSVAELSNERKRLNDMFYVYLASLGAALVFLLFWEGYLIVKRYPLLTSADWRVYIAFYLPIPLFGSLLGTFIYQVNKVQHQLVAIANSISELKYRDSLLNASMGIYSDGTKNEEHVALLIDNIMRQPAPIDNSSNAKGEDLVLSSDVVNRLIDVIKAFTGK